MKQTDLPLLRWTRFKSDSHGTGPEKRSAQILALCEAAGITIREMEPPLHLPRWRTTFSGLKYRCRFGAHASVDRAGIGLLGYRTEFYREALARHNGARVLLWETTYDSVLPALTKAAGFKIVALPHNLESLVSEKAFAHPGCDISADLKAEFFRLGLADRVFTISKEERWLLETKGLTPSYLPFFPTPTLERECLRIREFRTARLKPDGSLAGPLLLLGSGINPATVRGMRQQLTWLGSLGSVSEIVVAGPGTEQALEEFRSPAVSLLGHVTRDALVGLLETCGSLAIHTLGGAGAVTRIPEALTAGIPIIANSNAARDQHGAAGVYEYETGEEFLALASNPLPIPPAPSRPVKEENFFQAELIKLIQVSSQHA